MLNVLVSAGVTLLVLRIDRTWNPPPSPVPGNLPVGTFSSQGALPTPTLPSAEAVLIEVENVYGSGDLEHEVVVLRRLGENELSLSGWQLKDGQGNAFTFPDLTLYKGGKIEVYTRAGDNTIASLYWGRTRPVWQSGKVLLLVDYLGNERARFQVK